MKYLLIIALITLLLDSCEKKETNVAPPKYQEGEIVYIKPDSVKAVVRGCYEDFCSVNYFDKEGKLQNTIVKLSQIY